MVGKSRIDLQLDEQKRIDLSRNNEMVKKNRDVLKRFIDSVFWLFTNYHFTVTTKEIILTIEVTLLPWLFRITINL